MSKAVLISIQPKWCELIASGKKTIEVRKTAPKLETPFKCYMYMSAYHWAFSLLREYGMEELADRLMHETGEVIDEFTCDRIFLIRVLRNGPYSEERGEDYDEEYSSYGYNDCLTDEEFDSYLKGENGYGWHITNLVIYDAPKPWSVFHRPCQESLYCESCAMWSERRGCGNAALQITRPPQSWCYVEEVN